MTIHARADVIAGLRALADFLDANPGIPVRPYGFEYTFHADSTAEVDRIAALLDAKTSGDVRHHYKAERTFTGKTSYLIVHISAASMADYEALNSYATNVRGSA